MSRTLVVVMVCLVVIVACSFELGVRAGRAGMGFADVGAAAAVTVERVMGW